MQSLFLIIQIIYLFLPTYNMNTQPKESLTVPKCVDFELNGLGDNSQWDLTEWNVMPILDNEPAKYETKFKMLYSDKGVYVLGYCEDKLVTTDYEIDQGDIWNGDVFEVFLQTDASNPLYFEYEINPLNAELVILVPNNKGDFFGWSPWHYEGDRKVKKAVHVQGGKAETGAQITGWTAELFFPYELFKALKNVPPTSGTEWKGNFYRMDYDTGKRIAWSWAPIDVTFHEYEKFRPIVFK